MNLENDGGDRLLSLLTLVGFFSILCHCVAQVTGNELARKPVQGPSLQHVLDGCHVALFFKKLARPNFLHASSC